MSVLLITVSLLVFGYDVDDWQWTPGVGFVNTETQEQKTPLEFYTFGVGLATERRTDDALFVLHLLLANVSDSKLQEKARFIRGKILWTGSRFQNAYLALDDFLRRFPVSKKAEEAKQLEMDSAFRVAQKKETSGFWARVPLLKWLARSSREGLDMLRMSLQRYPREPFSSLYYYKMAELLFQDGAFDTAHHELKFILAEYPKTVEVPKAILLLGKIGLNKFDSIDYDIHGLKEARRHFERFIEEAPILSAISSDAAGFIQQSLPYAKEKVSYINNKEAEKEYRVGEYYRRKGLIRSARIYFEAVQKEYPNTSWAKKAETKLSELSP